MTLNAHAADHRSQAITLPVATSHRANWTLAELEFVEAFETERDEDIALALNRTLYAVRGIRRHTAERRATAAVRSTRARREWSITSWDAWERAYE